MTEIALPTMLDRFGDLVVEEGFPGCSMCRSVYEESRRALRQNEPMVWFYVDFFGQQHRQRVHGTEEFVEIVVLRSE
ncbi:hypothetical protein ABZ543_13175 [Streptomyces roseifaciens]